MLTSAALPTQQHVDRLAEESAATLHTSTVGGVSEQPPTGGNTSQSDVGVTASLHRWWLSWAEWLGSLGQFGGFDFQGSPFRQHEDPAMACCKKEAKVERVFGTKLAKMQDADLGEGGVSSSAHHNLERTQIDSINVGFFRYLKS